MPKPSNVATEEFLNGEIRYRVPEQEDEETLD
jgi:hypothetical protein